MDNIRKKIEENEKEIKKVCDEMTIYARYAKIDEFYGDEKRQHYYDLKGELARLQKEKGKLLDELIEKRDKNDEMVGNRNKKQETYCVKIVNYKGFEWYVLKESKGIVTLFMKDILRKGVIEDICDDTEMYRNNHIAHIKGEKKYDWETSYVRKVLNDKFLENYLDKNDLIKMDKDYVRLLKLEEIEWGNNIFDIEIEESYWLMTKMGYSDVAYVYHGGNANGNYAGAFGALRPIIKVRKDRYDKMTKRYENNCAIFLEGGLIKGSLFSDKFIKNNKKLVNDFNNIFDEIYKNDYFISCAINSHKNNNDLKNRLCDILDLMYDLNIEIKNAWDGKIYKNKNDYRKYILEYGKKV